MIKFRYYIDNQKEQDWLNKLSREGWALKKFFLGFYKFEKCEPGEYEYQIDLMPENVEQQDYYDFMEDVYKRQVVGTSLLTLTTSPIQLTDGIERLLSPFNKVGLPVHELAMMMTIALRFIPCLLYTSQKHMPLA